MDEEFYSAAVKFICYLVDNQKNKENDILSKQCQFIEETAGKISIDEDAINNLRLGLRGSYIKSV